MIEQITDSWWKLTYINGKRKFIFFGYNENEVRNKFTAWFKRLEEKSNGQ